MAHGIDSIMLYVHPPLAFIGYIFIIFSICILIWIVRKTSTKRALKFTKLFLYSSWLFNFLGLATGMAWAQLAWGSYWSWDPKENATLIIFVLVCLSILFYEYKKTKIALLMMSFALMAVILNLFITLGNYGLHSYGFF